MSFSKILPMTADPEIFLSDLSLGEMQNHIVQWGFPAYRARQIFDWVYQRAVTDFSKMKNLPRDLILALEEKVQVHDLSIVEKAFSHADKSVKYLFKLSDGELVEAVWMPQKGFKTICLSTQVGCPLKCTFCASGQVRFRRNLKTHEIIGQVLSIQKDLDLGDSPSHIVFMGMGEPLLNLENLLKSILILKEPWGFGIGARRITVSTAGYVPGIVEWIDGPETFWQVRLSISLHATHDSVRNKIMPINHKYKVDELIRTLRRYSQNTGRRVTFEYLLLKGLNDGPQDAKDLARLVEGVAHSVNVIEYNEVEGTGLKRSEAGKAFMTELRDRGVAATYRRSKGRDIEAACGQLRGKFLEKKSSKDKP